jgi:hypothetical protein
MAWAPDYVEAEVLADFVNIVDPAAIEADTFLAPAVAAASRAVDGTTHRQFGLLDEPEARYYTPRWDRKRCRWVIVIDDLMTESGLTVKADLSDSGAYDQAITAFTLEPRNNASKRKPWTHLVVRPGSAVQPTSDLDSVEVVARYGWTEVPTAVVEATLLQASRFYERRKAPFGVAGSPDTGSEVRLLAKLDPDVAVILGSDYTRWWGAA